MELCKMSHQLWWKSADHCMRNEKCFKLTYNVLSRCAAKESEKVILDQHPEFDQDQHLITCRKSCLANGYQVCELSCAQTVRQRDIDARDNHNICSARGAQVIIVLVNVFRILCFMSLTDKSNPVNICHTLATDMIWCDQQSFAHTAPRVLKSLLIQSPTIWISLHQFLSASLYFSKRGAYWDRLCRDVVGWLSRACTVAKRCILGL